MRMACTREAVNVAVEPVALAHPGTAAALRRYRTAAARAAVIGVLGLVVFFAMVPRSCQCGSSDGPADVVAGAGFVVAALFLPMGFVGLYRATRMRSVLSREPWVERRCCYRIAAIGRNGQPALLVEADSAGPEAVCSIPATNMRYTKLPRTSHGPLLLAGDPKRWAVVAASDMRVLLVAKRPLFRWWERRLRGWALGPEPGART